MKKMVWLPILNVIGLIISSSTYANQTNSSSPSYTDDSIGYDLATGLAVDKTQSAKQGSAMSVQALAPSRSNLNYGSTTAPTQNTNQSANHSWFTFNQYSEIGDGLAVGAQLGYSAAQRNFNFSNLTQTRGINGILGGLHLDYGYTLVSQFYLGMELLGNLEDTSATFNRPTVATQKTEEKIGNNMGFLFLPGYHLGSTSLIYAKLGTNYAKISINTADGNSAYDNWQWGSDFGVGMRQGLNEHISLALEYDWITYPQSISHSSYGADGSSKFSQQIYQLSLNYQFSPINPTHSKHPKLNFNGPYLGVSGGPKAQIYKVEPSPATYPNTTWSAYGVTERLKGGYGYQVSPWFYLAAEAFAEFNQNMQVEENNKYISDEKMGYGASLLPGYILNENNLLFARLGGIVSNLTGTYQGSGSSANYNVNKLGYQLGLGYETAITQAVSFIVEYDYTQYPSFTGQETPENITNTYNIQDNYFSLGLNYRF